MHLRILLQLLPHSVSQIPILLLTVVIPHTQRIKCEKRTNPWHVSVFLSLLLAEKYCLTKPSKTHHSNRQYLRVKDRHSLINGVVHVINDDDQTLEHKDHQQLNAKARQPGGRQHHQHKVQVGNAAQPGVEGGVVADLCFG